MAWIELKPEGAGPIRAWRADPSGRPRGGVVVVQEIFGVNAHIRGGHRQVRGRGLSRGRAGDLRARRERVRRRLRSRNPGRAAWRSWAKSTASRCCATSPPPSRSPRKAARSRWSASASAARSPGAAAAQLSGLSAAVGYYGGGIIGLKDLKPRVADAAAFRRQGPAHPHRRRERGRRRASGGRGPYLSRRSRLQL